MARPDAYDLLLLAVAAGLDLAPDHPDVVLTTLAVQESIVHWPDLLRHGWGRLSAYIERHQVVDVAVEFSHKKRQSPKRG